LISYALKWLREQKCETVRVSIAEGNESVHDFYRRFGFAERLTVMQLTKERDGTPDRSSPDPH
jgi:hypothetical protein